MKLRDEYLNEGYQKQRDNDYSLTFHHECSSTVFLEELSREKSYNDLDKIKINKDRKNTFFTSFFRDSQKWSVGSEDSQWSSSRKLIEEYDATSHY